MATDCAENTTPTSDGVIRPVSPQLAAVVKRAKAAAAQIWILLHSRSCTEGNACRMAGCVRTRRLYAIARAAQAPNGPRLSPVESGAVAEARKLLLHFAQCRSARLSAARRAATHKNNEGAAAAVPRPTCLVCSLVARARPTEARDGAPGGLDFTASPYDPSLPTPSLHVSTHVYHTRHGGRRRGNSVDATVSTSSAADVPNRRSSSGISGVLAGKHGGKRLRSGSCSVGMGVKSQHELTWAPSVYSPVKSRSRVGGRDWKQTAPPQDLIPRAHGNFSSGSRSVSSGSRNSGSSSSQARVSGRSRAQSVSSAYGNEMDASEVPLSTAAARLLGLARYQEPVHHGQGAHAMNSAASSEELREGADLLHFLGRRSSDDQALDSHSEAPVAKRPRSVSWAGGSSSSSSAAARPLAFGFENNVSAHPGRTPIASSSLTPEDEDLFGNAKLSPRRVSSHKPKLETSLSMAPSSFEEHGRDGGMRKGSASSCNSDDACTAPLRSGDTALQSTPRHASGHAGCPATPPAASAAAASAGGGGPLMQGVALETSSSSSSTAESSFTSAGSASSSTSGCDVPLAPLLVALDQHVSVDGAPVVDGAACTTADGAVQGEFPTALKPPPCHLKSPRSPGSDAVLSLLRLAGAAAHSPKGVLAPSPMDKGAVAQESS